MRPTFTTIISSGKSAYRYDSHCLADAKWSFPFMARRFLGGGYGHTPHAARIMQGDEVVATYENGAWTPAADPLVSVVEWHRYADKQPEGDANVIVHRPEYGIMGRHWLSIDEKPFWVELDRAELSCRPDDMWCYLPTPPEERP